MDNWNKIESVPTTDALIKEEAAVVAESVAVEAVEAVVEETPKPTPAPAAAPAPKVEKEDGVVLYALKDIVTASGLSISKGYSKVSLSNAKEFLEHKAVRKASPEEIKTYFNK
jgi:hypothetical protein